MLVKRTVQVTQHDSSQWQEECVERAIQATFPEISDVELIDNFGYWLWYRIDDQPYRMPFSHEGDVFELTLELPDAS